MVMSTGGYSSMGGSYNVPQYFLSKYGNGYADFGSRPYAQPYPMAVVPRAQETVLKKSGLGKLLDKLF